MDEDTPEPEPEKPRFLLPDGCKDLMDVVRLQQLKALAHELSITTLSWTAANPPQKLPATVILPDPVTIGELASALHLKVYIVIKALLQFDIFVAPNTLLPYEKAATLCLLYGVTPTKAS